MSFEKKVCARKNFGRTKEEGPVRERMDGAVCCRSFVQPACRDSVSKDIAGTR